MTQPLFLNYCKWNSTTSGTGSFTVGAAAAGDNAGAHATPANCSAINGNVYRYYAQSPDGSQTELGRGTYSSGVLARTLILANSDGTTSAVNFATLPIVDMFPTPITSVEPPIFGTGTLMLFQQTSAPIGWTKQTTHNDKTLRVVSGSASSGGSNAFSTVMAQSVVGSTTISTTTMPSHAHSYTFTGQVGNNAATACALTGNNFAATPSGATSGANGSGVSHNHTITMNMQYVDIIICSKD